MPRTVIDATNVEPQESIALTLAAADAMNGMMFLNDGSCTLVVRNAAVGAKQVTIVAVPDEAGRAVNYVKSVTAGTTEIFGPFRQAWWNQTTGNLGYVYVNFDDATSVTVGVINF